MSGINIFYQNVRGLRTKLAPLKTNLQTFGNYDVIILTETWLYPSISNSELGFYGYQLYRLDRNYNNNLCTRGGGVLIAVRSTYQTVLISTNISTVEHVFIHITDPSINIIVGAVYIPPNTPLQLYESHADIVDVIFSKYTNSKFLLCGDYNFPGVDWSSDELGLIASGDLNPTSHAIIDSFSYHNFFQLNSNLNSFGRILDLVFSSANNVSVVPAIEYLVIPDHYHPPLSIKFPVKSLSENTTARTYKDFKSANYSAISEFLNYYNWESTFLLYSIEDAAVVFNEALLQSIEWFVPSKTFKLPKFPMWTSNVLKNLILDKKRAHATFKRTKSRLDYNTYSELRAKCKRLSKSDYQAYIKNTEVMLYHKPATFWKYTRDLNHSSSIPCTVRLINETACTPLDSAILFSKYFSSVFNSPLPSSTPLPHYNTYPYALPSNCHFNIDDVHAALSNLKNNSSNGPDGISARLLYNCRDSMVYPLFILFRRSIDEGVFPDIWKTCSVTPVYKSGDPSFVSNYRPISILPNIAKLFESIIYHCTQRSLNHIIIDDQHGFRQGKSTVTSCLAFTTYILDSFEQGCQVDAVFTDFRKAFDTVDHARLICQLEKLGIGNPLLSWLQSYLINRRQFVKVHGSSSDLTLIPSGVPQGGHLSPLLFILFINSVKNFLPHTKVLLFADDIKIFLKIRSPSDCLKLQSDLNSFNEWTQALGLTLNISKCHIMTFSRKRQHIFHPYHLSDTPLERVFAVKDLGFHLTPSLSFENHINITIGKALKVLGFLKRNTTLFTSVPCLRVLYFSLVRSTLEYGIVVWHPHLAKDQLRLERVQNRFLAYVAFLLKIPHPQHDYTSISSTLNIPSLASRRRDADISFITSLLRGTIDSPDLLSAISFRVPLYPTRSHSLFHIPTHRTNFNHNHPIHRMLRILNSS